MPSVTIASGGVFIVMIIKNGILRYINQLKNKTFSIEELLIYIHKTNATAYEDEGGYTALYDAIIYLVEEGKISGIKDSGRYFMTPPLLNRYRITLENEVDKNKENNIKQEIMCLCTRLHREYYLKHINKYISDRKYIIALNDWLNRTDCQDLLKSRCTVNERSFQIFNDEKFLAGKGLAILNNLGLTLEHLNCYRTYEAFFYILFEKKNKGNVLIIENKDSFMSLLYYCQKQSKPKVYGTDVDMLIYGEGKKIINSFDFMKEIKKRFNPQIVFYWGDLDYTGIEIFLNLKKKYSKYDIIPYVKLYEKMLQNAKNPPDMKTSQNIVEIDEFTTYFDASNADAIKIIINKNRYIPQEAVIFE